MQNRHKRDACATLKSVTFPQSWRVFGIGAV